MRLICLAWILLQSALALLVIAPAGALPARVKVKLFSSQAVLSKVYLYGPLEILEPEHRSLPAGVFVADTASSGISVRSAASNRQVLSGAHRILLAGRVAPGSSPGAAILKIATSMHSVPRQYRGTVSVTTSNNQLVLVNDVDTHSYVTSCVGSEALPSFGAEALKAQTVLSTTLLEKKFRGKPIDDSTEEQSYLGATSERAEVKAAVNSVYGQELYYDGRPIDVFFCSTCGGTTTTPEIFGGKIGAGRYPYLKEIECQFCRSSPFFGEHREKISNAQFYKVTGINAPYVSDMEAGRPRFIAFDKNGHQSSIGAYKFWLLLGQHFGWGFVPSTSFRIDRAVPGQANMMQFVSRGCGHGVGLCQWGAAGQALAGRGYKEILYFYFPGTSLKNPAQWGSG